MAKKINFKKMNESELTYEVFMTIKKLNDLRTALEVLGYSYKSNNGHEKWENWKGQTVSFQGSSNPSRGTLRNVAHLIFG